MINNKKQENCRSPGALTHQPPRLQAEVGAAGKVPAPPAVTRPPPDCVTGGVLLSVVSAPEDAGAGSR